MATVTDLKTLPLSGYNHIDALLDDGPGWNFLLGANNTIYYTFAVDASHVGQTLIRGTTAFTASQQAAARTAMAYISDVTGIHFAETSDPAKASVRLWSGDIIDSGYVGWCSWNYSYRYNTSTDVITSFKADAWIYIDNVEYGARAAAMAPGSPAYETLLHELGHMLGLKHTFGEGVTLPKADDDSSHSLMSYTHKGGPYSTYSEYDLAALKWLYGGDGIGGTLGMNSDGGGRYLAGTARSDQLTGGNGNDLLEGGAGSDTLNGGTGRDTVVYQDARANHVVRKDGLNFTVSDSGGVDQLLNDERIAFQDMNVALDINGNAGQAYRLYQAAFDRAPDLQGLGYWIVHMDAGMSMPSVAAGFMNAPEFADKYGSRNPDNGLFITQLYRNVLNREPDSDGFNYYLKQFERGVSKADVMVFFSESPENQAQVIGAIQHGMDYLPYYG